MSQLLENVLRRLEKVKVQGQGYIARCPLHDDRTPSLSIKEVDGKILMHCFSCHGSIYDLADALGMEVKELFADGLSQMEKDRLRMGTLKNDLDKLDNTILFYSAEFEKNDLSAKSKIQYIEHIESRRKKLLEYKRIQTRLLEA